MRTSAQGLIVTHKVIRGPNLHDWCGL